MCGGRCVWGGGGVVGVNACICACGERKKSQPFQNLSFQSDQNQKVSAMPRKCVGVGVYLCVRVIWLILFLNECEVITER